MDLETLVESIDWWLYVIIVCTLFFIILALHYFVKKLNEARLGQNVTEVEIKRPRQSVQFQSKREFRSSIRTPPDNLDNLTKISLVFDKERRVRMSELPSLDRGRFERETFDPSPIDKIETPTIDKIEAPTIDKIEPPAVEKFEAPVIEKSESLTFEKIPSPTEYLPSVPLSDLQPSTNTTGEPKSSIAEIYQEVRNQIDTNVTNKLKTKDLSNIKPIDEVKTATKCCDEAAKQIKRIAEEQNTDINNLSITCKTCDDKDKSSKVEKPKIDKVEQNRNIQNDITKICKSCNDNYDITSICKTCKDNENSSKPSELQIRPKMDKNVKNEICNTCSNKDNSSKVEQNIPKLGKVEQNIVIKVKKEMHGTYSDKITSSNVEENRSKVVKMEQNIVKNVKREMQATYSDKDSNSSKVEQNKDINDKTKTYRDKDKSSKDSDDDTNSGSPKV